MFTCSYRHIAIIGTGLIGSSLARDLRALPDAPIVSGYDHDEETRNVAQKLGLYDQIYPSLAETVSSADLVILATPIGSFSEIARDIKPYLQDNTVISDTGSVKSAVIEALDVLTDSHIVIPAHPIAGTEHSGPAASQDGIFRDKWCIITPLPGTDEESIEQLVSLWRAIGAKTTQMEAKHHDQVLAITSHLPHLIAYTIVDTACALEEDLKTEVIRFSAGGFRDFTRIAASDPVMWRDIFLNNKAAMLDILQRFVEDLTALQRAIRHNQSDVLLEKFTRTRAIRRSVLVANADEERDD